MTEVESGSPASAGNPAPSGSSAAEPAAVVDGPGWLGVAQILVGNAVPVLGVFFLGWKPLTPIFFYWLDGLLAIWGLGVVALVVTVSDDPKLLGTSGPKAWAGRAATLALLGVVLAVPSVVAAMMVFGPLGLKIADLLREVFAAMGAWVSLAVAVATHVGHTAVELRWRPDLTLRATGEARANFFIHRTLAMGLLALWAGRTPPPRWALAAYVLVIACLFTFAQLNPGRYLHLIGFRAKSPSEPRKRRAKPGPPRPSGPGPQRKP